LVTCENTITTEVALCVDLAMIRCSLFCGIQLQSHIFVI
jgi:hypothetical protein